MASGNVIMHFYPPLLYIYILSKMSYQGWILHFNQKKINYKINHTVINRELYKELIMDKCQLND